MKDKQKEIIERIKALHPEISGKSLNEAIEGISGNYNHITTLEITQPLFTLTAEEINVVKEGLFLYDNYLEASKFNHKKMSDEEIIKIKNELEIISNLQIKIHDYQNEKKF